MRLHNAIILVLLVFLISVNPQEYPQKVKGFAVYYQQKLYFTSFDKYSALQDADLPKLKDNSRFHGVTFQGYISDHIILGLYANGTLNHKENALGSTNFGGGIAAIFGEYRLLSKSGFFASSGFGLGCGRVNYTSSRFDGTITTSVFSDAFFIEPILNIGYSWKTRFYLIVEGSHIFNTNGNNYYTGTTNLPNPFPNGFTISANIGYRFPFIFR